MSFCTMWGGLVLAYIPSLGFLVQFSSVQVIEKGDTRLVTHAFVRPGRSRDFVRHVGCASVELIKAVLAAHISVERVPVESGMDADAVSNAHAQLLLLAGVC